MTWRSVIAGAAVMYLWIVLAANGYGGLGVFTVLLALWWILHRHDVTAPDFDTEIHEWLAGTPR